MNNFKSVTFVHQGGFILEIDRRIKLKFRTATSLTTEFVSIALPTEFDIMFVTSSPLNQIIGKDRSSVPQYTRITLSNVELFDKGEYVEPQEIPGYESL